MPLTKEQTVQKINEKGFNASLANGVIIFSFSPEETSDAAFKKKVENILKEVGYNKSWGIVASNKNSIPVFERNDVETPTEDNEEKYLQDEYQDSSAASDEDISKDSYTEEDSGQMSLF